MVTVNGKSYDGQLFGNSISLKTDMSLAQIEKAFKPGESADVIVSEGEEELARYYNRGLVSIKVMGSTPREVEIELDLAQITGSAEDEIRESIDCSDGAIAELAEIVTELMDRVEELEKGGDDGWSISTSSESEPEK